MPANVQNDLFLAVTNEIVISLESSENEIVWYPNCILTVILSSWEYTME